MNIVFLVEIREINFVCCVWKELVLILNFEIFFFLGLFCYVKIEYFSLLLFVFEVEWENLLFIN